VQLPALPADVTELTIDASHDSYDPLDEILALFRANTFFRNFEIKGPADRVLIYGILYVSEVLGKIKPGMGRRDAEKVRCGCRPVFGNSRLMQGTGCHERRTR
jgi:actin related protein 2/3 complex subunit 3